MATGGLPPRKNRQRKKLVNDLAGLIAGRKKGIATGGVRPGAVGTGGIRPVGTRPPGLLKPGAGKKRPKLKRVYRPYA